MMNFEEQKKMGITIAAGKVTSVDEHTNAFAYGNYLLRLDIVCELLNRPASWLKDYKLGETVFVTLCSNKPISIGWLE